MYLLWLVVGGGRERLRLFGGDGGVSWNELGHDPSERFNTQRKRRNIEQQDVLDVALQHATLNGGSHGDDFIGVHSAGRLLAKELFNGLLNFGHSCHTADKNDLVDVSLGYIRIFYAVL